MSKSLGNVIDPLTVIDQYGTDSLRFTMATGGRKAGGWAGLDCCSRGGVDES
jgi:valyl-tRNA synthetase